MAFKFCTFLRSQALPVVFGGDADIVVVRRFGILVIHLEEDQIGELLQVVAIADPVIAQGGAKTPDSGNDGGGVHAAGFLFFLVLLVVSRPLLASFLSALIWSRRTDAGSSLGSCATSWPLKAFFKIDWRRASAFWS